MHRAKRRHSKLGQGELRLVAEVADFSFIPRIRICMLLPSRLFRTRPITLAKQTREIGRINAPDHLCYLEDGDVRIGKQLCVAEPQPHRIFTRRCPKLP